MPTASARDEQQAGRGVRRERGRSARAAPAAAPKPSAAASAVELRRDPPRPGDHEPGEASRCPRRG